MLLFLSENVAKLTVFHPKLPFFMRIRQKEEERNQKSNMLQAQKLSSSKKDNQIVLGVQKVKI